MKKYLMIILIFSVSFQLYGQSSNFFGNIHVITPKDYFNADNTSYYFGYDGIKTIKIDNSSLIMNELAVFSNHGYGHISFSSFLTGVSEALYADDGSLVIYRTNNDFSCQNDTDSNCLYSPVYIRKINKKSLTGNMSLYRIDNTIPLEEKDIINFPAGSELYSIVVEVPGYDLSTFLDMTSLVCSKNEDNLCRGVINNGVIDKAALFELSNIKEKDKYEKVSATITRIDKVYNSVTGEDERVIYVSYEVEGVIYSDVKLNWQSNFMFKGEVITISYLKDNPNIIKSEKENYTAGVILLVMGIIFLGCSGYMIYEIIKKKI